MQQMGKSTKPSTSNITSANGNTTKADRKTAERNRRNHMKTLYSELNSLISHHNHQGSTSSCREATPLLDQIDEAVEYIKNLREKLEKSKRKRDELQRWTGSTGAGAGRSSNKGSRSCGTGYKSPKIEIQEEDYAIEVILITGLECQFIFNEAIRILHEEATEVINATFNAVQDTVYHTIHAKTGDLAPSFKAARISERLKQFAID